MKTAQPWRVVQRPEGIASRYAVVVVDSCGLPHLPLTIFYHEIQIYLADGTARTYLHTLLPFFEYLASDAWREHRQDRWESEPDAIRQAIRDYLVEQLHCKARLKNTYQLITLTAKSPSTVRVFLSALKQFYHVARRMEWYPHAHPLIDPINHLMQEIEIEERRDAGQRPQMPQLSGVEDPKGRSSSDNYFKLVDDMWCPRPIDDPDLHVQLRQGFKLAGYCLRDQIVVRMAYESGARIREILRLTIGDWRKRGAKQEAWTFSKGSHGRRVKVLRFSPETSRMLHSYVNTERAAFDPYHRRMSVLDDADPLFLSSRGNPYDYDSFKKHWYRLCKIVGIDLNIHGLRHWFVTQQMRLICEEAKASGEIERGKEALVRYMAWRSPKTLEAYEHYFQAADHTQIQDQLFLRLYERDRQHIETSSKTSVPPQQDIDGARIKQEEQGWETLLALGGISHV
jgi:integrase